jgi:hypothetical protein
VLATGCLRPLRGRAAGDAMVRKRRTVPYKRRISVKWLLTVKERSSWPRHPATVAAFWPHEDAQRCHLLRISEQNFSRSAMKWGGSGCA